MYPAYKLIRSINRTYPNNGFINAVNVDEETYRNQEEPDLIPEDFRDILNECIMEIYKDVAIEETWSFPTVPGQNQYALPVDCDLRDIIEVTRTNGGVGPRPIGPIAPIEVINGDELPPPPPPEFYPGWVPHRPFLNRYSTRLRFARDAEELTGDRYFNAWDNKKIGISPTPMNNFDIITIFYKKTPKTVMFMDDDIEIKDNYIPLLRCRVLMELAKAGSHPDIDLYNAFTNDFNTLLLKAKRDKDSDKPYYDHIKDNSRPPNYYRRGPRRRWNRW